MRKRRLLTAVAGAAITACLIAGTAWGATAGWQDVWNQIRPLLSDPGTVNNADNPVHWTKLKGVPAGFADGLDNGVDKAGFGLTKNLFPEVNLAVDTARIQRLGLACGAIRRRPVPRRHCLARAPRGCGRGTSGARGV